jgi:hypothetical protein
VTLALPRSKPSDRGQRVPVIAHQHLQRPHRHRFENGWRIQLDVLNLFCQNGVMDYVLHPIEPLAVRLTVAGAF